jgi:hypothetical protein
MKTMRPFIDSNEVPYHKMILLGSHSTSGRDKNEERKGLCGCLWIKPDLD